LSELRQAHLLLGLAVIALVGAFAAGRASSPESEVREVERVVYKDKVVEVVKTVTVREQAQARVIYRDRVTKPDGTRVEREVERTETKATEHAQAEAARASTAEGQRVAERTVTPRQPQWRAGVLVGAQLRLDPLGVSPAVGAHVERRLLGPLWLGAWGLHTGSAGLSLSLEF
jgi:hypothetical protein